MRDTSTIIMAQSRNPGPKPATNSFPMEMFVTQPYTMRPIPGGMRGVMMAEEEETTLLNALE